MSDTVTMFCAGCRADSDFEHPPCSDGHGTDCPDLVCVRCGLALFAFVADESLVEGRHEAAPRRSTAA